LHDKDTSNQPLHQHQPLPMMQKHFDEVFMDLQKQIQEQHLILDAKIQTFLAFFEQQHNNLLQMIFSPPE